MSGRSTRLLHSAALAVASGVFFAAYPEEGRVVPTLAAQTAPANPCDAAARPAAAAPLRTAPSSSKPGHHHHDGNPRGALLDVLWKHRSSQGRAARLVATPRATEDVGDVAVIQDEGDLITPANLFDLRLSGLRYVPKAPGGYDVVRTDASFRAPLGDRVLLSDDDSAARNLSFPFTFFGTAHPVAFISSDGNLTFGEADGGTGPRTIGRLLSGPPRIAAFLADLDPSVGGAIFARSGTDAFTATWCGVPVFGSNLRATFQIALSVDGTIDMRYADTSRFTANDAVVGISPGHTEEFLPVNLSTAATAAIEGNTGALGERFVGQPDINLLALARKFYHTHSDIYDQLVVWTDTRVGPENTWAYEFTISNDISGIGLGRYDFSREFGATDGRLGSLVYMNGLSHYPNDPTEKFADSEGTALSLLGQEVGHRWLAFLEFTDHNRQRSSALLGRGAAHWSFFFNSDASVMEGNRIQDLGGGSFRTIAAEERYSLLDQYAMGLVRDTDVPPLFYVESPTNVQPAAQAGSSPRVGVTFTGTRRNVLIGDIIEVMGRREPSVTDSPKVHRQAFILVMSRDRSTDRTAVAKLDRIRRAWERFFNLATNTRFRAETRLRPPR